MGNESSLPMELCSNFDADEIRRLGKRFRKLDLDNSGALSIDEFMSLPELQQNPLVQRVIDIFDADGNGEVDFKVLAMLQLERLERLKNGNYVTFEEHCVIIQEMQSASRPSREFENCKFNCEVFLGGSCNPTTWRADTVIPALRSAGITFYNPQASKWAPELVAEEHDAKQTASVLFFVIDSQTRSTSGMIEVSFLVASGRYVILVANPDFPKQNIMGEQISTYESKDLSDAQSNLLTLVESRCVKVHKSLASALECTCNVLKHSTTNGVSPERLISRKLDVLRRVFDSYKDPHDTISVLDMMKAYSQLTQHPLTNLELYNYLSRNANTKNFTGDVHVTFDKFCALIAEFSKDGCDFLPVVESDVTSTNSLANASISYEYEIYLGGSVTSKINWRDDVAIPLIKNKNFSYYNPLACDKSRETQENGTIFMERSQDVLEWKKPIDKSRVLLFVVTEDTRSLTSMILAAYYIGLNRQVVLCVRELPNQASLATKECLTKQAVKDYNRGRVYLTDLAKRRKVPVFDDVHLAVDCALSLCSTR